MSSDRSLFIIKNGLSAALMTAIWQHDPSRPFEYFYDGDERYSRDVEYVVARTPGDTFEQLR